MRIDESRSAVSRMIRPGGPFSAQAMALAAVLLQLLITVPLAFVLNVWQDDAYTLHSTAHGVAYAFHEAIGFEQNAPLYFVLIAVWRLLGTGYVIPRLYSVACAALTVYLLPRLVDRYLPGIRRWPVTLAVALNPFLIWAALEIRVYAMAVLLSALLLLVFYDAFIAPRRSSYGVAWYGLICAISAYTEYYLVFVIVAQGVALLVDRKWQAFKQYCTATIVAALSFVPMLWVISSQVANFRGPFAAPSSPVATAETLAKILVLYILPFSEVPHYKLLYVALVGLVLVLALSVRRYWVRVGAPLIMQVFGTAFVVFAVATYLAKVHILYRHGSVLFVAAMLTVFSVALYYREPVRRWAVIALMAVSVLSSAGNLAATYRHGAKLGDWARVSAYLLAHEHPGEPILVFGAENALPLAYYYKGPNRIVPIPAGIDFRSYDVSRFIVHNARQIDAALARVPASGKLVWLVTAGSCRALNVSFGCTVVEDYVKRHYTTVSTVEFYGSELRLLRRRDAPVSMPRHALDRR